jgi:DNA-binding transcriptional regulator GbsR (MarR family)
MQVIATLPTAELEFSVQEVVEGSKMSFYKPFKQSHVSKMLKELAEAGLVYKYRWGKYSLAVPLMSQFIQRQTRQAANLRFPPSANAS